MLCKPHLCSVWCRGASYHQGLKRAPTLCSMYLNGLLPQCLYLLPFSAEQQNLFFFRKENLISFIVNNNLVTHIYINPHCLLHCFFAALKLNWLRWLVASLAYHIIHVCCLSHPKWVKTFIIKCLSIYLTIAPKHKPSLNARTQRISISTVLFSMSVTWYVLNIGLRHNVSVFLFNCIRFVVQLFAIEVDLSPSQCVLWIQDHFLSV